MTTPRNEPDIGELRRLEKEATPGPWEWDKRLSDNGAPRLRAKTTMLGREQTRDVAQVLFHGGSEDREVHANARLITEMRAALVPLLDLVDSLTRERDEARRAIEQCRAVFTELEREAYPEDGMQYRRLRRIALNGMGICDGALAACGGCGAVGTHRADCTEADILAAHEQEPKEPGT